MNHAIAYCTVGLLGIAFGFWLGWSDRQVMGYTVMYVTKSEAKDARIQPCIDELMRKRREKK